MSNKVIIDYKPHKYQQLIHSACSSKSKNIWTIVCAGRQSGKSQASIFQGIKWVIDNPSVTLWYVTPSEGLGSEIQVKFLKILQPMGLVTRHINSNGKIRIELANGSKIVFKSAESGKNLRGSDVHYMIIDEAAWIDEDTLNMDILPTMASCGRKVLMISTPRGKNHFYKTWLLGQDGPEHDINYKSLKFNTYDNPYPSKEKPMVELAKKTMPKAMFEQEYLADWIEDGSLFSNVEELAVSKEISSPDIFDSYYIGIDVGFKVDDTVITIINSKGEIVYIDAFKGIESPEIALRIKECYNRFKPHTMRCETNNMGLGVVQQVQAMGIPVEEFSTGESNKAQIIQQLVTAFSSKSIRILDNEELKKQLMGYIFEMQSSGRMTYHGAPGFHDDYVMSLAIAWDVYLTNNLITESELLSLDDAIEKYGKENKDEDGIFIPDGPDTYIGREHKYDSDIDDSIEF